MLPSAGECQLYLDVDCSSVTYDTEASPVILQAVNTTLEKAKEENVEAPEEPKDDNSTVTPDEALSNSLLTSIGETKQNVTENELKEAFCRDVDSFSWEFGAPRNQQQQQGPGWNQNQGPGWNRGTTRAVGIGAGTTVLIVLLLCGACCTCGVCLALKKKRSKRHEPPVTFSEVNVNDAGLVMGGMGDITPNPGYKAEATPQHGPPVTGTYSNTGVHYPGPPAIPPTQPGYTNFPGNN